MKVVSAEFTRRFNVGDYEHEEYKLTAQVEDMSGTEVLAELKKQVTEALTGETTPVEEKPKKAAKKSAKKEKKDVEPETDHADDEDNDDEATEGETSGDDGEGAEDDEATVSEDDNDSDDSSDDDSSDEDSSEDEEDEKPAARTSKKSGSKKAEGKKGSRKKPQVYNREIEQHRDLFSGVVRSIKPDWKKSEAMKAKAKEISQKMEGEEFLDEDGEVLPAFFEQVKKQLTAKK